MPHINVKVVNTFGTFQGKITLAANSTNQDAQNIVKELIGGINTMQMLSIETEDGDATVFGEQIIKQSVISAKAVA